MEPKEKSRFLAIAGLVVILLSALQLLFFINQLLLGIKMEIPDLILIIAFLGIILSAAVMLVLGIIRLIRHAAGGAVLLLGSLSLLCFELLYFIMLRGNLSEKLMGSQLVIPFGIGLLLAGIFFVSGILALVMGISRRHSPAGYWGLLVGIAAIVQLLFFIAIFIPMISSTMGGQNTDLKIVQACQANQQALEEGMKLYMEMEYLPLHPNATPAEIEKAAQNTDLTFKGFKVDVGGKEVHYGSSKQETFSCPANKQSKGNDYKVVKYAPAAEGKLGTFRVECQFDPRHNQPIEIK